MGQGTCFADWYRIRSRCTRTATFSASATHGATSAISVAATYGDIYRESDAKAPTDSPDGLHVDGQRAIVATSTLNAPLPTTNVAQ